MPYQYTQPPIIQQASKAPATPDPNAMMMMLMEWFKNGQNIKLAREQLASEERRSAAEITSAEKRQSMAGTAMVEQARAAGDETRKTLAFEDTLREKLMQRQNLDSTMGAFGTLLAQDASLMADPQQVADLMQQYQRVIVNVSTIPDYLRALLGMDAQEATVEKLGKIAGQDASGDATRANTTSESDGGIPSWERVGNNATAISRHATDRQTMMNVLVSTADRQAKSLANNYRVMKAEGKLSLDPRQALNDLFSSSEEFRGKLMALHAIYPELDGQNTTRKMTPFEQNQILKEFGGDTGAGQVRLVMEHLAVEINKQEMGPDGVSLPSPQVRELTRRLTDMSENMPATIPEAGNLEVVYGLKAVHETVAQETDGMPINVGLIQNYGWGIISQDPDGFMATLKSKWEERGLPPMTPADEEMYRHQLDQGVQTYIDKTPGLREQLGKLEAVHAQAEKAVELQPELVRKATRIRQQQLAMTSFNIKNREIRVAQSLLERAKTNGANSEQIDYMTRNISNLYNDLKDINITAPIEIQPNMPSEYDPALGNIGVNPVQVWGKINDMTNEFQQASEETKLELTRTASEAQREAVASKLVPNRPGQVPNGGNQPMYGPTTPGAPFGPQKETPVKVSFSGSHRDLSHLLPQEGRMTPTSENIAMEGPTPSVPPLEAPTPVTMPREWDSPSSSIGG